MSTELITVVIASAAGILGTLLGAIVQGHLGDRREGQRQSFEQHERRFAERMKRYDDYLAALEVYVNSIRYEAMFNAHESWHYEEPSFGKEPKQWMVAFDRLATATAKLKLVAPNNVLTATRLVDNAYLDTEQEESHVDDEGEHRQSGREQFGAWYEALNEASWEVSRVMRDDLGYDQEADSR